MLLCSNAVFFGNKNEKETKSNPWGLYEDKSLWKCCGCFNKAIVAPAECVIIEKPTEE